MQNNYFRIRKWNVNSYFFGILFFHFCKFRKLFSSFKGKLNVTRMLYSKLNSFRFNRARRNLKSLQPLLHQRIRGRKSSSSQNKTQHSLKQIKIENLTISSIAYRYVFSFHKLKHKLSTHQYIFVATLCMSASLGVGANIFLPLLRRSA